MSQGVHRQVRLRPSLALGPVVAGAPFGAALGRRLQGPTVQDCGAGLGRPPRCHTQHLSEVMDDRLEAFGSNPALGLLVDGLPGRQVMRQHPPGRAGASQIAQTIEEFSEVVPPLGRIGRHQGQVRGGEGPLVIGHVTGVRRAAHAAHISRN